MCRYILFRYLTTLHVSRFLVRNCYCGSIWLQNVTPEHENMGWIWITLPFTVGLCAKGVEVGGLDHLTHLMPFPSEHL